jgi:hypothetical protein
MRPVRAAIDGAQPNQYPNPNSCGVYNNQVPQLACYTYAGTAELTWTRPRANLTITRSDTGVVQSFQDVVFTAGSAPAKIGSVNVPFSEVTWQWLPDGNASELIVCTGGALTCSFAPISSGTMYVSAYVNGEWQYRILHIRVAGDPGPKPCALVPEVANNYPEIASAAMDSIKQEIWRDSRILDLERGGYVVDSAGTYTLNTTGWISYPCNLVYPSQVPSGTAASLHPHTYPTDADLPLACGADAKAAGDSVGIYDWVTAIEKHASVPRNFIITRNYIVVYWWNKDAIIPQQKFMVSILLPRCGY